MRRHHLVAGLAVAVVFASATSASAASTTGQSEGDTIKLTAREGMAAEQATAAVPITERLVDYLRRPLCDPDLDIAGVCFPGDEDEISIRVCGGEEATWPLWRRTRATILSPWSEWENVVAWTCPRDYIDVPTFTAEDFRRLPLAPPVLNLQPARTEHLVNMPTIVYTDAAPQHFTTDLLGYTFEVEATPTGYTWDFGDGTVLTTTSPGHPYPDHDVAHPYTRLGTYTITLTTTYTGRYRLAGDPDWTDVDGTATTTTSAPAITIVEARTRLVTSDCNQNPTACE